jgi:2-C-methyl-D-erythritol 4-phosphate cytidylyltransferase
MNVAIVVAAGKGSRLGGDRPKQFLELGGIPVIIHTLRQFERSNEIHAVITVLPAEKTAGFESVVKQFALKKVTSVIAGGATRAQSVRNGLRAISDAEIVAVHDGVRPFVTPAEIDATVAAASRSGAAILTAPVADTIKRVEGGRVIQTSPRASLRRALTPQCFRFETLKRAYEQLDHLESTGVEITDDCFLVEKLNVEIVALEGNERNIKITNAEDLAVAETLLKRGLRT